MEDLIHEIYTVGKRFKEANNFLWPFKLSSPQGGMNKKTTDFVESRAVDREAWHAAIHGVAKSRTRLRD